MKDLKLAIQEATNRTFEIKVKETTPRNGTQVATITIFRKPLFVRDSETKEVIVKDDYFRKYGAPRHFGAEAEAKKMAFVEAKKHFASDELELNEVEQELFELKKYFPNLDLNDEQAVELAREEKRQDDWGFKQLEKILAERESSANEEHAQVQSAKTESTDRVRIKMPLSQTPETMTFFLCDSCMERVDEIEEFTTTSADFSFCDGCATYLRNNEIDVTEPIEVVLVHSDECDCGNQIRHNTGGNYHYDHYRRPLSSGKGESK